ncbi:MAG TPA: transglutaminase family protein [Haliangiales bacterium]|nr:transglutaminase family protein [Haliangiales bacterium]
MSSSIATEKSQALSESQKTALVKLLSDEDPAVYHLVREKILSCGQAATGWMQTHVLSSDPVLRRRAQEIIDRLARQSSDNRFLAFCLSQHGEELDVEQGSWLLAQTRYPEINVAAYQALFDSYAGDLRERIDFGAKPEQILATINQYLFTELGFHGNEQNYYEPENSYLNRVIDRRTGNAISLCLVYLFVSRRLHLPVTGIGMPGHFLCRFQCSTEEFYINAFNRGKLLSRTDCVKYLVQTNYGFQEGLLSPATPRRILLRMCSNLHQIYLHLKLRDETERLQRYIVALAK